MCSQGNGSPRMSAVSAGPVPQEADGDEMERPRSRASINRDSPEPSSLTMLLRGAADITPRCATFKNSENARLSSVVNFFFPSTMYVYVEIASTTQPLGCLNGSEGEPQSHYR